MQVTFTFSEFEALIKVGKSADFVKKYIPDNMGKTTKIEGILAAIADGKPDAWKKFSEAIPPEKRKYVNVDCLAKTIDVHMSEELVVLNCGATIKYLKTIEPMVDLIVSAVTQIAKTYGQLQEDLKNIKIFLKG